VILFTYGNLCSAELYLLWILSTRWFRYLDEKAIYKMQNGDWSSKDTTCIHDIYVLYINA
jgi:hypothetical protein